MARTITKTLCRPTDDERMELAYYDDGSIDVIYRPVYDLFAVNYAVQVIPPTERSARTEYEQYMKDNH